MEMTSKVVACLVSFMLCLGLFMFFETTVFAQPVSYKQYVNDTYGIQIEYPSDWNIDQTNIYEEESRVVSLVIFSGEFDSPKDQYRDNVVITLDNIPYKAELDEYMSETLDSVEQLKNFRLISSSSENLMLAGHPAYEIVYTYTDDAVDPPIKLKVKEIGTIVGRTGYFLEIYSQENSYEDYATFFDKMVESFKLTAKGVPQDTTVLAEAGSLNDSTLTDTNTTVSEFQGDSTLTDTNTTVSEFQGTSSPAGPGLKTYENTYFGIRKLEYPDGWSIFENETSIQFTSPARSEIPPSVHITTYLYENRTLEDFVENIILYLSSDPYSYQIMESKPINLKGNLPAHMVVMATFDNQSNVYKALNVFTIKNEILYDVSYLAEENLYPKYLPSVISLIRSLDLNISTELQNNENIKEPPAALSPL